MKKLVFVLIALLCFFLIACNEKQVNENLDSKSVDNKINLESKHDLDNNLEQEEIVYDEQLNVETSDIEETNQEQKVNDDEKTQGEESEMSKDQLIAQAKQTYLELYLKRNRTDAVIDDVWLFNYLGIYNDCIIGVFLDRKNCVFPEYVLSIQIENICFDYSCGYEIMVYKDGLFYTLYDAYYKNKVLNIEEISEIYKVYNELS